MNNVVFTYKLYAIIIYYVSKIFYEKSLKYAYSLAAATWVLFAKI